MNVELPIGIIADDITGGAAVAGEIARNGRCVKLLRSIETRLDANRSVVLETGSRYLSPQMAQAYVIRSVNALKKAGFTVAMKKIDSTLKGNVAAELAAFKESTGKRLIVIPACPEVRIAIRDGVQWKPGGQGGDVKAILQDIFSEMPAVLPLAVTRQGPAAVTQWLRTCTASIVLVDSELQEDMNNAASGALMNGETTFAGTYGLGAALTSVPAFSGWLETVHAKRMVVIAGSTSSVTQQQIQRFTASGVPEIRLDVKRLLGSERAQEIRRVYEAVPDDNHQSVVVHTDAQNTAEELRRYCAKQGWSENDLAQKLAEPFSEILQRFKGDGIFFIGGETTGAIFDVLSWKEMEIFGEFAPGIPVARIPSTDHPFVLTKPGAFSDEAVLLRARAAFCNQIA